ncbi:MAG: TonB family protein [Candidatus Eremiobacteraeota bacterium]|nr:TonB family protein [Candidatus Eremiobacteraeota bacterium]
MSSNSHNRAYSLAGAIALGEATDAERLEYRQHLMRCPECLRDLGGEFEIERVAAGVGAARDAEIWAPDLRDAVAAKMRKRKRFWRVGLSALGACFAVSFFLHVMVMGGLAHLTPTLADPLVIGGVRISIERRTPERKPPAPPLQRRMVVMHNVVQMSRAPVVPISTAAPAAKTARPVQPHQIAAVTVHANPPVSEPVSDQSNVPIWRRGGGDSWRTLARTTTTALSESAPQTVALRAQPIQIAAAYTTRDAAPVGGETAINPQPPMIAYDEGAEGTSVFEVMVDERGTATKCVITKSAGYTVLDDAVCKAALSAHYTPKTLNGKAVPGVYRDAFTFRMSDSTARDSINQF